MTELKRSLSLAEISLISIGNIIGAGVFILLGTIIRNGGTLTMPILAFAAIFNILAGLVYAELGSAYQSNAVEFEAINDTMGPFAANISTIILLGFLIMTIATLALMFGAYISDNKVHQLFIAFLLILLLSIINLLGIELSKIITNGFGVLKLAALSILIILGISFIKWDSLVKKQPKMSINTFTYLSFLAIFLFNGYDAVVKMSDEVKDPANNIPKSIIISIVACTIIYALIGAIAIGMNIPAFRPINEMFKRIYSAPLMNIIVFVIGLITIFNTTFISMLALSRYIYGLARKKENFIPESLAAVNEKYKTPHYSIFVVFVLVIAALLLGSFEKSTVVTNVFLMIFMSILTIAAIMLRYTRPNMPRPFKIPLNIGNFPMPSVVLLGLILGFCIVLMGKPLK